MDSRRFFSVFCISSLFLFICIVSSCSSSSSAAKVSSSASDKVSLALYYETLCPYCSAFIVNHLKNVFEKGLITIVDLKLVPYGNAKIGSNNSITCQHGPYECLLNTVEACAIDAWPDLNKHFIFIYCIESLVTEGKYSQWESCFGKLGLGSKPISDCYNGGLGKKLELQYAADTNALQPPHTYVPWVVVDGQPLYEDYENFVTYICKAYKGTTLPKACRTAPLQIIPKEKQSLTHRVSYPGENPKETSSFITRRIMSAAASS